MVAPAPKLKGTPGAIRTIGPDRGAHNGDVYGGLLGIETGELDHLRETGVI
jgi:formyl-CoA transferase